MKNIALFVKDFQKGTELSNRLVDLKFNITFAESIYDLPDHCEIGIIDLDNEKYGNIEFIKELKNQSGLTLIGYMDKVKKGFYDDFISAGCNMIIPSASISKNLKSLINEIIK
jgi:hypothetical protein|tara:strand:- start:1762 stop:2100 length:339 start_codon:yes stop_codon:yes gene_type:complete